MARLCFVLSSFLCAMCAIITAFRSTAVPSIFCVNNCRAPICEVVAPNGIASSRSRRSQYLKAAVDMNWDPKSAPKLDFNEDFYSVLEVDPSINAKDLKKAYYKIVFKYHPDNKDTEGAKVLCNQQMMVINAAYKVLKDPDARATYDRKRKYGGSSVGSGVGSRGASSTSSGSRPSASSSSTSSSYGSSPRGREQSSTSTSPGGSNTNGGSYYDDFFNSYINNNGNGNGFNQQQPQYEPLESLQDILADLMGEFRRGGPAAVLEDFLGFLEDQVPGGSNGDFSTTFSSSRSAPPKPQSRAEIQSEIDLLRGTVDNLQKHLSEMRTTRNEVNAEILVDKANFAAPNAAPQTLQEMEVKLSRIEALKGLEARITAVEKQLRDLQKQLRSALERMEQSHYPAGGTAPTGRSESTDSASPYSGRGGTNRDWGTTFTSSSSGSSTSSSGSSTSSSSSSTNTYSSSSSSRSSGGSGNNNSSNNSGNGGSNNGGQIKVG